MDHAPKGALLLANRTDAPQPRRERRAAERATRERARPRTTQTEKRRPAWQSPIALVTAAAVVVAVVAIGAFGLGRGGDDTLEGDLPLGLVAPFRDLGMSAFADGETLGSADAPVTLEVVGDYQCPACGTFALDFLPRLLDDFVATGQLRIVDRTIAFLGGGLTDESAAAAVGASCAADQDAYWSYHDWLYRNQDGQNRGGFRAERLAAIGEQIGLDTDRWASCVGDPARTRAIRNVTGDTIAAGIDRTPTLILAGELIVGLPPDYETMAAAVRTAIAAAPGER